MIKTDDNINLQPNERIRGKHGDYEILGHVVKHGGFSAVYKAHSLGSNYGGLCAVKENFQKNFISKIFSEFCEKLDLKIS